MDAPPALPARSLATTHPRLTPLVALALAATMAAFTAGLLLPAIRVTKLRLFDSEFSILSGLGELAQGGNWLVFAVILIFSVLVPYAKLAILTLMWWWRQDARHARVLEFLHGLSRWSMLDVLVMAVTLITLQSGFFVRTQLMLGTYLFAAAALASMTLTAWVSWRARTALRLAAGRRDSA